MTYQLVFAKIYTLVAGVSKPVAFRSKKNPPPEDPLIVSAKNGGLYYIAQYEAPPKNRQEIIDIITNFDTEQPE
ncbi:MAG: hypothetical protein F6K42_15460 [Leptolyngbya sp. SIO1D8]|nr:hypothetical protein [Leptolyngbya sp. SIO1D8]